MSIQLNRPLWVCYMLLWSFEQRTHAPQCSAPSSNAVRLSRHVTISTCLKVIRECIAVSPNPSAMRMLSLGQVPLCSLQISTLRHNFNPCLLCVCCFLIFPSSAAYVRAGSTPTCSELAFTANLERQEQGPAADPSGHMADVMQDFEAQLPNP